MEIGNSGFSKTKARFVCLKMGEAKGPGEKDVHKKGLSSNSAATKVDEPGFMVLQACVLPFLRFYWL